MGSWTTLLNDMMTPSILMGPIPGSFWPFCCQTAVKQDIMHLAKLVGSDGYDDLPWSAILQRDNILPDEPLHLVRAADKMHQWLGHSSRKLMTAKCAMSKL